MFAKKCFQNKKIVKTFFFSKKKVKKTFLKKIEKTIFEIKKMKKKYGINRVGGCSGSICRKFDHLLGNFS